MTQETINLQGNKQLKLWGEQPSKFTFIFISGKAGVGKSTAAKFIKNYLEWYDYFAEIVPMAREVKNCARDYFGWDGNKDEKGRRLLQRIGTDIGREYDPDNWIKRLINSLKNVDIYPDFVIIDDWRFPNEASYIENLGEFNVVKIRIDAYDREILRGTPQEFHESEISLPSGEDGNGYYDFVLFNSLDTSLDNLKGLSEKIVDILFERSRK